jgi:hypothetical protein
VTGRARPTSASSSTAGPPAAFGFVQLEFGFLLGPPDGRYLVRAEADGPVEAVLVLGTLGAPERRRLRGRRGREVEEAGPEPVPTSRVTVVRPEPFGSRDEAAAWLASLRGDEEAVEAALDEALRVLNRTLRARRAATADPWLAEVSPGRALVARIGYGAGEAVAEGRFGEALELPRRGRRRVKRSMEAPEERFAALLGARERALVGEELVLRARADLDAGAPREAALQTRVALEALIAELGGGAGALDEHRRAAGEAANAALHGELPDELGRAVADAVAAMEAALKRHRLRG